MEETAGQVGACEAVVREDEGRGMGVGAEQVVEGEAAAQDGEEVGQASAKRPQACLAALVARWAARAAL